MEKSKKEAYVESFTLRTIQIIDKLFDADKKDEVISLLVDECGNNLPFCEDSSNKDLERIRFAAIKLSNGDIGELKSAIKLAQADWRDLLMCADFGCDINAHNIWADTVIID